MQLHKGKVSNGRLVVDVTGPDLSGRLASGGFRN